MVNHFTIQMPRSSSPTTTRRHSHSRSAPAPAPAPAAPAPAAPSTLSRLGGVVAEGFAFSTGAHLARHAVDKVLGSNQPQPSAPGVAEKTALGSNQPQPSAPCAAEKTALINCHELLWDCTTFVETYHQCMSNHK